MKKILLILLLALMTLSMVSAECDLTTNIVNRFPFVANHSDVVGTASFSNTGVTFENERANIFGSDIISKSQPTLITDIGSFSLCVNINRSTLSGNQVIYDENDGSDDGFRLLFYETAICSNPKQLAVITMGGGDSNTRCTNSSFPFEISTDYSVCFTYDNITHQILGYQDDNLIFDYTNQIDINTHNGVGIGGLTYSSTYGFDGQMWNLSIFNSVLSEEDISCYAQIETDITHELNTDMINNTINFNDEIFTINYNISLGVDNTQRDSDCELYIDSVLEETQTNRSEDTNYQFIYNVSNVTADKTFEIYCENSELNSTTGIYNYKIDTVQPFVNYDLIGSPTYTMVLDDEIALNLTCVDDNLYACGRNLSDSSGTVIESFLVENLSVISYNNYSTRTASSLGSGNYTFDLWSWDSHTKNIVETMEWYFQDNNLVADGDIIIEGDIKELDGQGNPATYFYIDPLVEDRYKFKVTFNEDSLQHTLYISTTGDNLKFIADSEYMGHFVHFKNKRWIDFMGQNVESVDVTSMGGDRYEIIVNHYTISDEIEFESIGSLNEQHTQTTFEVLACPEIWVASYSSCSVNDSQILTYIDTNSCGSTVDLPLDNGTVSVCNYCTITYTENVNFFECNTLDFYSITYTYDNYATCCGLTNITEDCELPTNQSISCIGLHSTSDITGAVVDIAVEGGITLLDVIGLIALFGIMMFGFNLISKTTKNKN